MKPIRNLCLALAFGCISLNVQAAGDPMAGKAIAEKTCQACHGADGNSSSSMYPRLAGQHADYLAQALKEYRSGARTNAIMQGMVAGLSEQDIANVTAWFASQQGLITPNPGRTISQ
jgi:cytochrome c553